MLASYQSPHHYSRDRNQVNPSPDYCLDIIVLKGCGAYFSALTFQQANIAEDPKEEAFTTQSRRDQLSFMPQTKTLSAEEPPKWGM